MDSWNDYLSHHGVKGQQWGVMHGPPYPIEDGAAVRIKKGTHIKRLTTKDESKAKGHAYVNYNKNDAHRYKGFFGTNLKRRDKTNDVMEVDMEAVEDLLSPSKKERVSTFIELYKTDKSIGIELGRYTKTDWHTFTPFGKKFYENKWSKLNDKQLETKGYNQFVKAIGGNEYIRSEYFKRLMNKGYNFVQDDCDAGKYGRAPSIIIDRNRSVKYNGQTKVDDKEIKSIYRKEGIWLNKNDNSWRLKGAKTYVR